MKVNKSFIKFYNATFKFILKLGGLDKLIEYFRKVCPLLIEDLDAFVAKDGISGAARYWNKVLPAEHAEYDLKHDDKELVLIMHRCPSVNALDEPCREYCRHCSIMYGDLFKKHGYKFELQKRGPDKCTIKIRRAE